MTKPPQVSNLVPDNCAGTYEKSRCCQFGYDVEGAGNALTWLGLRRFT